MEIRKLKASEIECRVGTINEKGCSLLLYKDARCDMRILDEIFGAMNWQRSHEIIDGNLYCSVSVLNEKGEWVSKQDVGVESFTEKEKGQASDSFKRACVNWGIGRELYTAPFIWVNHHEKEMYKNEKTGKVGTHQTFHVTEIGYNSNGDIDMLMIADEKGVNRFKFFSLSKMIRDKKVVDYLYDNKKAKEYYMSRYKVNDILELDLDKVYNELHNHNKI